MKNRSSWSIGSKRSGRSKTVRSLSGLVAPLTPRTPFSPDVLIRVHLRLFGVIILTLLALCGCARHSVRATGNGLGVFRYALVQEPTSMDPARSHDVPTKELLQNIYSGLV